MPSKGDGTDFGFGVCPVTCDPKIVYIHDTRKKLKGVSVSCSNRWQVEVFTLSSGVWRSSYGNLPGNSVEFGCGDPSVTIDGSINWLVGNVIISFDLSTEEFKEIRLSNELYTDYLFLLKLNDSLALVSVNLKREDICKVWMMENGDSGSFINRFTFKPYKSVAKLCVPLEFRRSGELVMKMIDWRHDSAVVVACTPFSEQLNEVGIKGWSTTLSVSPYTESLLLLDR
ncbi:uncharacterized protein LOC143614828 [Bidens hawaiensis]|uniref:uncharacterized protein LOC143614828 n=1 Tax=Bidens hawaiensis TaxID=980011 RepID=UPI00404A68BC